MNTPCANSQYLAAYLAEQDREEKRAEWIEREAEADLKRMKPFTASQIDEAISESIICTAHQSKFFAAFNSKDALLIGNAIIEAVDAYWLAYCTNQAADAYDDGAAEDDYGRY